MMPTLHPHLLAYLRTSAGGALAALLLLTAPAHAQTAAEINDLKNAVGNRIEAATILGGDFGMAGASYNTGRDGKIEIFKLGGGGNVGDTHPLGSGPMTWQPVLQGDIGQLSATRTFTAADTYGGQSLAGAQSKFKDVSVQFGGGVRFSFNEHFSIAPTFTGMYGRTQNTFDPNDNLWAQSQRPSAKALGLVDYTVDTLTLRPAADFQYVFALQRATVTLNSDPTYFNTQVLSSSNPALRLKGESETWQNKIDIDVPLGMNLWGHELHTGGYFSRTELYGGLRSGLNIDHLYEIHGRVVLDYLGALWKTQWIGVGYSYLWGGGYSGFSAGIDITFRF